jgi:serine/threonine protein kinase
MPISDSIDMSSATLSSGTRVGPYIIEKLIGKGGMGEVYLAQESGLNRKVALKFISPEMTHDADVLKRFEAESRILALVNHANVVSVFGVGKTEFGHYIAMEYVDGNSIAAIFSNIVLPASEAAPLFCQMLDGVLALHQRSVVHRDLKPANVIFQRDNMIKILDLGIAKVYDGASANMTATGVLIGTIKYLAPEVAAGRPATAVSDIWSLGAIFYEMLSGSPLILAPNHLQAFSQLAHLEVKFSQDAALAIPVEMQKIIEKMCAKDPEFRYNDGQQIRQAIEAFMKKYPSENRWHYRLIGKQIKNAASLRQRLKQAGFSEFTSRTILFEALGKNESLKRAALNPDATVILDIGSPEGENIVDSALNMAISNVTTKFRKRHRPRTARRWIVGISAAATAFAFAFLTIRQQGPAHPLPLSTAPVQVAAPAHPPAPSPASAPLAVTPPEKVIETAAAQIPDPEPLVKQSPPAPPPPLAKPKPAKLMGPDFAIMQPEIRSKEIGMKVESRSAPARPTLEWSQLAGAESYQVQVSKSPEFTVALIDHNLTETRFPWTTSSAGRFYWRVRGTNGAGKKSNFSEVGEIDLKVAPPELPSEAEWSDAAPGRISWTPSPLASGYRLTIARDPAFADLTDTRQVNGTQERLAPPPAGTYYARVVAMNSENIEVSKPSNPMKLIIKASLAAPAPVSPPKGATLLMSSQNAPLLLFWNTVDKAQEYEVQLAENSEFKDLILNKISKLNRHTHKHRLPKGRVFWRVRAVSPQGSSPWSETRHFEVR